MIRQSRDKKGITPSNYACEKLEFVKLSAYGMVQNHYGTPFSALPHIGVELLYGEKLASAQLPT